MADNIRFDGDSSPLENAINKAVDAFKKYGRQIEQTGQTLVQYDVKNDKFIGSIKATDAELNKQTITFQKAGDSYKRLAVAIQSPTDAALRAAQRLKDVEFAAKNVGAIFGSLNLSKLSTSQINQVDSLLRRIQTSLGRGGVSQAQFDNIFSSLNKNINATVANLSPQARNLQQLLRQLFVVAGSEGQQAAQKIQLSWSDVEKIFASQVIYRTLTAITHQFRQAVLAAADFSLKVAEIRTISQAAGLSTQEWTSRLTQLSDQFGRTQTDVAAGAYETISNQVARGRDVFAFLNTTLRFSQAAVTDTANSVNLLTGALTSFNLPAQDAERVAAILFRTIDLGRVRAEEMSNTFGRIGAIASAVGVNIEEVSAAVATLTIRGVKFNDATVLINNILLKLIKPTQDMQELLDDWGVHTGEAAIQTFGFGGVLQRLSEEAKKGGSRIADLAGEMRAIRGVLTLSGSAFDDFNTNLAKISDGADLFNNAVNIIQESVGQRFNKQLNEIKTFFSGLGLQAAEAFVNIAEAVGGARRALEVLFPVIRHTGTAYLLLRFVVPLLSSITVGHRAAAAAAGTQTAAVTATSFSYKGLATSVGAAALKIGGLIAVTLLLDQVLKKVTGIGERTFGGDLDQRVTEEIRREEELAKVNEKFYRQTREAEARVIKEQVDNIDRVSKLVNNYFAERFKLVERSKKIELDALKEIEDETKVSSRTFTDSIQQNINNLKSQITQAKNDIEQSLKIQLRFEADRTATLFNAKSQFADEFQSITLIENRIGQLTEQAKALFAEGTTESVQEARSIFKEIENLETQRFSKITQNNKKLFEDAVAQGKIRGQIDAQGRERFTFVANTAELESRINGIYRVRAGLEDRFRQQQQSRTQDLAKQVEAEKTRLRNLDQVIKSLVNFSIVDKGGNILEQFEKDPREITKKFDELKEKLFKDVSPGERLDFSFFGDINKLEEQSIRARDILLESKKLEENRVGFNAKQKDSIDTLRTSAAIIEDTKEDAKELERAFKNFFATLKDNKGTLEGFFKSPLLQELPKDSLIGDNTKFQTINRSIDAAERNLEDIDRLSTKVFTDLVTKNVTPETLQAVDALNARLSFLSDNLNTIGKTKGLDFSQEKLTGRQISVEDELRGFESFGDSLQKLAKAQLEANQAAANLPAIINRTKAEAFELLKEDYLEEIRRDALQAGNIGSRAFDKFAGSISGTRSQLDDLRKEMQEIKGLLNVEGSVNINRVINDVPAAGQHFGGRIAKYFAQGGFVPKGGDRIPAMLEEGEFVSTKRTAAKFAPLLSALNSSLNQPKHTQPTTVNFYGGINTNFNAASQDTNLRNFAKGLRREIKRGNIIL